MPRTGRIVLPDLPHHVIHRGHNRSPVFVEECDYRLYLDTLAEWKERLGCGVFAFCLMTNHVHLVVAPGPVAESLSRLMKRLAGRYTRYVNRAEGRSGTVWNGRFQSSPIETDRYLMACCRYVELNPVRAAMVASPEDYPWSSYRSKIGASAVNWLDEDPCYLALGATRARRQARSREWVEGSVPDGEWDLLRSAVRRGQLSGSERFRDIVEQRTGRRIELRGPGRPKK